MTTILLDELHTTLYCFHYTLFLSVWNYVTPIFAIVFLTVAPAYSGTFILHPTLSTEQFIVSLARKQFGWISPLVSLCGSMCIYPLLFFPRWQILQYPNSVHSAGMLVLSARLKSYGPFSQKMSGPSWNHLSTDDLYRNFEGSHLPSLECYRGPGT